MKYIGVIGIFLITILAFYFFNTKSSSPAQPAVSENPVTPTITLSENISFTASFEIFTLGTKRIFTDPRYHNQSEEVYLEASDPSIINVEKTGVTWSDFFETLPMSLTKECLITGTGQTFCSNGNKLRFLINGEETPDALDLPIGKNDKLEVVYGG